MNSPEKKYNELSESEKRKEDWMNSKWRPAMGWMYMTVCITDFIIYPVLWAIFQDVNNIHPIQAWEPLTLKGAGLFHMAMGAVLGIAVWSRGQEKLAGVNVVGTQPTTSPNATTISSSPTPTYNAPVSNVTPNPPPTITSYGGRAAPPPAPEKEL